MKSNSKKAGKTGVQPTANAGVEHNFPPEKRIVSDALAPKIFSGMNAFWIQISKNSTIRNSLVNFTEKLMPGGWSMFLVRKRYIDTKLIETVAKSEVESIVNLGAGMDTRLYRLHQVEHINCWEMDQPESVKNKRNAILKAMPVFPKNIKQVPINFLNENLGEKLIENGYDPKQKTFFIWEAVSQYLDTKSLEKVFEFYSKACEGSHLVFTYVRKDFVEGKNLYNQKLIYKLSVKNDLWRSSFHPEEIQPLLDKYGWELLEDVGYDELDLRYVKPTGRKLGVCEIERAVFARKK